MWKRLPRRAAVDTAYKSSRCKHRRERERNEREEEATRPSQTQGGQQASRPGKSGARRAWVSRTDSVNGGELAATKRQEENKMDKEVAGCGRQSTGEGTAAFAAPCAAVPLACAALSRQGREEERREKKGTKRGDSQILTFLSPMPLSVPVPLLCSRPT